MFAEARTYVLNITIRPPYVPGPIHGNSFDFTITVVWLCLASQKGSLPVVKRRST